MPSASAARSAVLLTALLGAACEKPPPEPVREDPCPEVALDRLAGDWLRVEGSKGDHRTRFRIRGEPGAYDMVLIPGTFSKIEMAGKAIEGGWEFDQELTGRWLEQFRAGERLRYRARVKPHKETCSLRVVIGQVQVDAQGQEKEQARVKNYEEFLPMPADKEFTFEPATGQLFLGEAAKSRRAADAQLASFDGQPKPDHELGEAIPVGVFTRAEADGPEGCTYDMDLYFDDRPYTGRRDSPSEAAGKAVPAGEVEGGWRPWYVPAWFAPFSGNHSFEIYRYRTCGGARERIEVHALEAILG